MKLRAVASWLEQRTHDPSGAPVLGGFKGFTSVIVGDIWEYWGRLRGFGTCFGACFWDRKQARISPL
jgi:hypothetical protein